MRSEYKVNILKLNAHIDDLRDERSTVVMLQEKLEQIKRNVYNTLPVDSNTTLKFQRLSQNINELVDYYNRLIEAMENINQDAIVFSRTVEALLEEHKLYMKTHNVFHA